jgi:hypothetical protein
MFEGFLSAVGSEPHLFNNREWHYVCSHKWFPIKTQDILDNVRSCIWVHTAFNINYIQSIKRRKEHLYYKLNNNDTMLLYIENPRKVNTIDYYIDLTKNFHCHFCIVLPSDETKVLYQSQRINIIGFYHTDEGYSIDTEFRPDLWNELVNIFNDLYTFDIKER